MKTRKEILSKRGLIELSLQYPQIEDAMDEYSTLQNQQLKEYLKELLERFEEVETIAFANEHLPGPEPIVVKIKAILESKQG